MDSLGMPVTLVVKAPNQKIEDQMIQCELTWTIRQLKGYLSSVYPSKPRTEDQRLIYSGQLLNDNLMLKDVLRTYSDNPTHTVHLVCAPLPPDQMTNDLRQRMSETRQAPVTDNIAEQQQYVNTMYTASPDQAQMMQQMYLMQQAYAQYMAHYLQTYSGGIPLSNVIPATTPATQLTATSQQPQNPQPARNPEPERPRNIRMNAQGGAVIDDDDEELGRHRDLLDYIYIFARVGVLFSIVYFYSNAIRFGLVALLGVSIYFYQLWLHQRHRERQNQNNNHIHNAENQNNNNAEVQQAATTPAVEEENTEDSTGEENESDENNRETELVENRPNALILTWTFVSTFFYSLFPEMPGN